MDNDYYINVNDLMEKQNIDLPRPSVKIIFFESGEDP